MPAISCTNKYINLNGIPTFRRRRRVAAADTLCCAERRSRRTRRQARATRDRHGFAAGAVPAPATGKSVAAAAPRTRRTRRGGSPTSASVYRGRRIVASRAAPRRLRGSAYCDPSARPERAHEGAGPARTRAPQLSARPPPVPRRARSIPAPRCASPRGVAQCPGGRSNPPGRRGKQAPARNRPAGRTGLPRCAVGTAAPLDLEADNRAACRARARTRPGAPVRAAPHLPFEADAVRAGRRTTSGGL